MTALVTAGCSSTATTKANWQVVANDPSASVPRWTASEVLRIGDADQGPAVFGDIGGLAVDSGGRVYLLDWQTQELRLFGADGRFLRTVARRGKGPGEMTGGAGISIDRRQNAWVWDVRLGRFTVFDSTGALVATVHRRAIGSEFPWVGRFDDDGYLYDVELRVDNDVQRLITFRLSPASSTWRKLSPLVGYLDLTATGVRKPMGGVLVVGIAPDGSRWVGHQREARFWKVAATGDTVLEAVIEGQAPALDRHTRDSLRQLRWGPTGHLAPDDVPRHRLAFRKFWVGDDGNLYIASANVDSLENRVFDVLDSGGRRIATLDAGLKLETGPMPEVHSPFLYGTTRDHLGVEYFVKLRIHRPR